MVEEYPVDPDMPSFENDETDANIQAHQVVKHVRNALSDGDHQRIIELHEPLHASDAAEILGLISTQERQALVNGLGDTFDPETLTYLDEEVLADVIDALGTEKAAAALTELESDDAVSVIEDLDEKNQRDLIEAVQDELRTAELQEGLAYPEESAGRLMQKRFVAVPEFWNVGNVIDFLRESLDLPTDFYEVIVVDPRHRPVGTVMISRIMQNPRDISIADLMKDEIHPINTDLDQEEVANLFRRYGLAEAPVVNESGRIVGVITIDDIVHVITEEDEEDYLRSGGIIDRDLHASLIDTVKRRLPWLVVNLMTASLAALVISRFEATIEQMVTLAVLMPIIASISGNAGIQSVTISVRAIATRELQRHNAWPVICKEMFTNLINGIALSLLMAIAIFVIYGNGELAGIFSLATIGTLAVAGFCGALIPLILNKLNIDPAIASGVFLTTLTDVLSFFSFLGLAALMLLN